MATRRIRIGYYMYTPAIGGAEQYFRDLLWNLDRDRYEVTLFYEPWSRFETFLNLADCPPLRRWPIPVYESHAAVREQTLAPVQGIDVAIQIARRAAGFGIRTLNRYLLMHVNFERLRSSFLATPLDVIHINNGGYPGAWTAQLAGIAAKSAGIPLRIMTVNNTPTSARFPQLIERMFDPPALASIDHFIAVAQTVGHVLTKRYAVSPNRITPIYYGIADPLDSLSVQTHTAVRAGLGLGLNTLVIGMPARFAPEKGHRYLIQALSSIRDQIDGHIDVVLMGSGQLLDQSRLAVRDAGLNSIIKFTGQISHEKVLEIMKICELIVLPSEIEGLPYVISEAMSMGKPVIATAVGGVPEQIVHGETGLVIQPREPADLAQAILHLVKQPELREKMGRAARTRYEHYFTLNRMLRDHDALYQTLYQNYYATGLDHHTGL